MIRKSIAAFLFFFCIQSCTQVRNPSILIQPFEGVNSEDIHFISSGLESQYGFKVFIAKPQKHFLKNHIQIKSSRYRADSIIRDLARNKPDSIGYVLGFTSRDISTTKKINGKIKKPESKYSDWGIFGLGYRPGVACIISDYRLGSNKELRKNRLMKIAIHEIGHNLGLKHCPNKCVMKDAAESIKTIDDVPMELCEECKNRIN